MRSARGGSGSAAGDPVIIGQSPPLIHLLALARRAAGNEAKVLITGESGVGKDLIARYIHLHSRRACGPFLALNCGGLTETLLETELFGHIRGSFTEAYHNRPGKLQLADRGTLFLDEVGEMSLRMQGLLLRFLETGEIQPVGSSIPVLCADVRIIAATNRSLEERVSNAEFREDLLYRLRVIPVHVPPLRDRAGDIPELVGHFIARTGRRVTLRPEVMELLCRHRWPGNVRELQNVIEQMVWLAEGDEIGVADVPPTLRSSASVLQPARERRRHVSDELYDALVSSKCSFWQHIYPLFISRDITRDDIRELVKRGLRGSGGNYRALMQAFGMPPSDYKRFRNFLVAHDCKVDFRAFRKEKLNASGASRRDGRSAPATREES